MTAYKKDRQRKKRSKIGRLKQFFKEKQNKKEVQIQAYMYVHVLTAYDQYANWLKAKKSFWLIIVAFHSLHVFGSCPRVYSVQQSLILNHCLVLFRGLYLLEQLILPGQQTNSVHRSPLLQLLQVSTQCMICIYMQSPMQLFLSCHAMLFPEKWLFTFELHFLSKLFHQPTK